MKKTRISELLDKYIAGNLNADEHQELTSLYDGISSEGATYPDSRDNVNERMLQRLNNELLPARKKPSFFKFSRTAAAILAISCSAVIYLITRPATRVPMVAKQQPPAAQIVPGTYSAVLTLGNGRKIYLNSSTKGKLAVQGNTVITKYGAGQIVYNKVPAHADAANDQVTYNTITTPAGGQFRVTLPDGSNVWLNAASSLRYPSRFEGAERHVELQGEAYFEIYKNRNAPFTVNADKVNIEVLGTHFNVMAYRNEPSVNTTLLEGSVSLSSDKTQKMLIPGQQAVADRASSNVSLYNVNVEDAVAWKNGYFSFRKNKLSTAMNKIARWYNVDVEYRGSANDKVLGGTISRTENIDKLLNYIELTGIAKFKLEGRRVIVICK